MKIVDVQPRARLLHWEATRAIVSDHSAASLVWTANTDCSDRACEGGRATYSLPHVATLLLRPLRRAAPSVPPPSVLEQSCSVLEGFPRRYKLATFVITHRDRLIDGCGRGAASFAPVDALRAERVKLATLVRAARRRMAFSSARHPSPQQKAHREDTSALEAITPSRGYALTHARGGRARKRRILTKIPLVRVRIKGSNKPISLMCACGVNAGTH